MRDREADLRFGVSRPCPDHTPIKNVIFVCSILDTFVAVSYGFGSSPFHFEMERVRLKVVI